MADSPTAKAVDDDLLSMTAMVVAAYVRKNTVPAGQLREVIDSVYRSLRALDEPIDARNQVKPPAVAVKRSITPDHLICLEDGKKLKMLKRHLRTTYGLSPDAYRQKWGLSADYPMVAPNYAHARSLFAKRIGLGRGGRPGTKRSRRKTAE